MALIRTKSADTKRGKLGGKRLQARLTHKGRVPKSRGHEVQGYRVGRIVPPAYAGIAGRGELFPDELT